MDIWLETTSLSNLRFAHAINVLTGIILTPPQIAKTQEPIECFLNALSKIYTGPIAIHVTTAEHTKIIEQAETLRQFSDKILIQIPVTQEGLKAISTLSHLHFPVMATGIVNAFQGLLAIQAGASFIVPSYRHIKTPTQTLQTLLNMLDHYEYDAQLLITGLETQSDLQSCLEIGVDAASINDNIFQSITEDQSGTFELLNEFSTAWKQAKPSKLLQ